ncbi:MAG: CDP-glucose 4,6-dehydratase [Deltaproteobacteria bacterium]|nr:CDP-glucose 4,6-dehydratase [Deltaproteobacteria bacterium]
MCFSFFKGKRVFLTGHTGFKGAWLSRVLIKAGAELSGYALAPPKDEPSLYEILNLKGDMTSIIGDIRDFDFLLKSFKQSKADIVIHMAAQPLVEEGYRNPRYTYETNVLGTVNILECLRLNPQAQSFLNVTTDKVYKNREWVWGYREDDALGGTDPYSSSKSSSELATAAWKESFFKDKIPAISTARAGNVIGGGDFAENRLVPDCVRAASKGKPVLLRNPYALRPYQHVLEALSAYMAIIKGQYMDPTLSGSYNVGPEDCLSSIQIAELFGSFWGLGFSHVSGDNKGFGKEASTLILESSLIKHSFGYHRRWDILEAMKMTVKWSKKHLGKEDMLAETDREIQLFFNPEGER